MAVYSNIDLETFKWVSREVENTLETAETDLQRYVSSDDKSILYCRLITNARDEVCLSVDDGE